MSGSARRTGAAAQIVVARWFAMSGWPYAQPVGSGRAGVDVTGMPGLACEVKGRREFKPDGWVRQASGRAGLPFVVLKPYGMGPAAVDRWPVIIPLAQFTELLRAAGYGSEP